MKAQPAQPSSASVARAAASSSLYPKRRTSPPALSLDGDDASTSQPPPAKRQCSVSPSRPAFRRATPTDDVAAASSSSSSAPVASTSSRPSAPATGSSARSSVTAVSSLGPASVASALAPAVGPVDRDLRSLLELEYRDDVRAYMAEMETRTVPAVELIDMQPELQWYMRPYLVDFLIEVHQQHTLRPETLYLAMNIVDRYVSKRIVFKKHYQLVGCAALWIAAKFEDAKDRVPSVQDLCQACCGAYEESAFVQMEGHVLSTIGWIVGHPTAEAWLRIAAITPFGVEDIKTQHVARFLMEITLFHRAFVASRPSDIAAAALLLARHMCGRAAGEPTIVASEAEMEPARLASMLDTHLAEHLDQVSAIAVKKYSFAFYARASTLTREFYLGGRRLQLAHPTPAPSSLAPPSTPSSAPRSSASWDMSPASSCSSASSVSSYENEMSSDADCDEPITPITPMSACSLNPMDTTSDHTAKHLALPSARPPVVHASSSPDRDAMEIA